MTTQRRWHATSSEHRKRFESALRGDPIDRQPVSAWQHYPGLEYDVEALSSAIAASVLKHDWDWVKINPRGVYYAEVWGAEFDHDDYGGGEIPRLKRHAWESVGELAGVEPRAASPVLAEQVELVRQLRLLLPDRPLLYTVFSPLSVLYQGLGLPLYAGGGVFGVQPSVRIDEVWGADSALLHGVLEAITATLVEFTADLLEAGADGLFYAVTGTPHPLLSADREWFATFSTPYDQRVLHAAAQGVRVLHTCGPNSHPEWFVDWPVDALHWDSFATGNPALGDLPVVSGGGVDHRLFDGEHDDLLIEQAAAAVRGAAGRGYLLSPTCTVVSGGLDDASLDLLALAAG